MLSPMSSGTKVTTTDDVVGLVVFWDSMVTRAVVILSPAFQSSSSSSMRGQVRMVAWVAQCWFGLSCGRRVAFAGLLLTKLARGFDHSEMSLIHSGPDVSKIRRMALPMLLLSMFPLMAVEPKGRGEIFGNLTNLNLSKGSLLGGVSSSGLLVLEKSGPSGKDPSGVVAGTMANKFPIVEVLTQNSFDNDAKLDAVPSTGSLPGEVASMTGRSR